MALSPIFTSEEMTIPKPLCARKRLFVNGRSTGYVINPFLHFNAPKQIHAPKTAENTSDNNFNPIIFSKKLIAYLPKDRA